SRGEGRIVSVPRQVPTSALSFSCASVSSGTWIIGLFSFPASSGFGESSKIIPMGQTARRRSEWLASASVLVTLVLFIAGNAFQGATPISRILSEILQVTNGWWIRLSPLFALAFAIVGALSVARRPGNRIGWVVCGIVVLTALYQFVLGCSFFGTSMITGRPGLGFLGCVEEW